MRDPLLGLAASAALKTGSVEIVRISNVSTNSFQIIQRPWLKHFKLN